jgi:Uncharacterized small protein (DUF2158).
MKTILEIGDIVMLKSGGPMMTVERVKDDDCGCIYFPGDDGEYGPEPVRAPFPIVTLAILGDC